MKKTISIKEETNQKLQKEAKVTRLKQSQIIEIALEEYFDKRNNKETEVKTLAHARSLRQI